MSRTTLPDLNESFTIVQIGQGLPLLGRKRSRRKERTVQMKGPGPLLTPLMALLTCAYHIMDR